MKKALKIIYTVSIILFGILWILEKFEFQVFQKLTDFTGVLVLIYLFTSLKYYQMDLEDKNDEIQELKTKLEKAKTD